MSTTNDFDTMAEPSPGRILWPLVPGLLFVVLVIVALVLGWQSPPHPLDELRTALAQTNATARQAALATLQGKMRKDVDTALNPDIALEMLGRLDRLVRVSTPREETFFARLPGLSTADADRERSLLLGDRDYLQELLTTLSCSMLPVGLPLLRELTESQPAIEPLALAYRRRPALNALAVLGESLQRWDKLPASHSDAYITYLSEEPATGQLAEGVQAALRYLQALRSGQPDLLGLDATLAKCASDPDPVLREGAAFCSRYWTGTSAQNQAIDAMLLKLTEDDGAGEELRTTLQIRPGPEKGPRAVEASPGFLVRGHAVIALAWRGSPRLPLDDLKALLDLNHLKAMLLVENSEGQRIPNQARVLDVLQGALQATVQLRQKDPMRDLSSLRPVIAKLAAHPSRAVQQPAEMVRAALEEKPKP